MDLFIDVEMIADKISPKKTTGNYGDIFFDSDKPLLKEIFLARDIKDIYKRMDHLILIIRDAGGEYDNKFTNSNILFEGKDVLPPTHLVSALNGHKPKAGYELSDENEIIIEQCWDELKNVHDLFLIEQMIREYRSIKGKNERVFYLLNAKEGKNYLGITSFRYYRRDEFGKIIESALNAVDKTESSKKTKEPTHSKNTANPPVVTPTTRTIALYFYYLSRCDGPAVSRNNAGQLAIQFGKTSPNSGNDLYNRCRTLIRDSKERTGITGNSNGDNARLKSLEEAIELIRSNGNKAAVKLALGELKELQNSYDKRY